MSFAVAAPEGVGAIRFSPGGTHLVTTGYLPFLDGAGLWQQKGVIRFWRVADGSLRQVYDQHTGLAVTSPVAWSPGATHFSYGTYEGTAVVAKTPLAMIQADHSETAPAKKETIRLEVLSNRDVLLHQFGNPGAVYHVEASTNLISWKEAGLMTANNDGYGEFLDSTARGFSTKYYRTWRTP